MNKLDAGTRISCRFDRSAGVLAMMQWFAGQDIPVLPIHGVIDGGCMCGDDECASPGKHPISSLVPPRRQGRGDRQENDKALAS